SALDYLATASYHLGDLGGAIEAAQRLSAVAAEVPEYALRLAALLREDGQTARAVALYQHVSDCPGDPENIAAAREALRAIDALQLPVMVMLASESRTFLREVRENAVRAMLRHGFALSRDGLAGFLSMIHELSPAGSGQFRLH
ncbi:MAG: hypothetical protein HUU35_11210, partial [Armatimonadetes bacterium]|nr:hypothetical protein [Armatimonadota bacterium]